MIIYSHDLNHYKVFNEKYSGSGGFHQGQQIICHYGENSASRMGLSSFGDDKKCVRQLLKETRVVH